MQPNGGFFGSMMPSGASSFMPQGPSGASLIAGAGATPNGFTSPPMGPDILGLLQKLSMLSGGMQQQNGSQTGSNMSSLPPNSFAPGAPQPQQQQQPAMPAPAPGAAPNPGAPGAPGGMNPQMLMAILSRMGIGAGK